MTSHKSAASIFACMYLTIVTAFMIALGAVSIYYGNLISQQSYRQTSHLNQIADDWSTVPFVNLERTNSSCQEGWTSVYDRFWYGQMLACDCLGINSTDISTDNQMVL